MTATHHQSPDVQSWLLAAEEENSFLRERIGEEQKQRAILETIIASMETRKISSLDSVVSVFDGRGSSQPEIRLKRAKKAI